MDVRSVQELMDMLTGKSLPEGMAMKEQPRLSSVSAFGVIWFLQEYMKIMPSNFEMCVVCHEVYDTHYGGFTVDGNAKPDEWHESIGVTPEMLKSNDGKMFCSEECEFSYWMDADNE